MKMLSRDAKNNNFQLAKTVQDEVNKALNPKTQNGLFKEVLSLGKKIGVGVAQKKIKGLKQLNMLLKGLQSGAQITDISLKIKDTISRAIQTAYNQYQRRYKGVIQQQNIIQAIDKHLKQGKTNQQIANILNMTVGKVLGYIQLGKQKIVTAQKSTDDNQQKLNSPEGRQVLNQRSVQNPQKACKNIAKIIAQKLVGIANQGIISPLASHGMQKLNDRMFKNMDNKINNQLQKFQNKRRQVGRANKHVLVQDFDKIQQKKQQKIQKRARQEQQVLQPKVKPDQVVNKLIADIQSNGQLGLHHLESICDILKQPIAIYDKNGNVLAIIGQKYQKQMIKVMHLPDQGEDAGGHWLPMNQKNQALKVSSSGRNNCLLDAVCTNIKKDPVQMRKQLAKNIRDNPNQMRAQAHDISKYKHYMGGHDPQKLNFLQNHLYTQKYDMLTDKAKHLLQLLKNSKQYVDGVQLQYSKDFVNFLRSQLGKQLRNQANPISVKVKGNQKMLYELYQNNLLPINDTPVQFTQKGISSTFSGSQAQAEGFVYRGLQLRNVIFRDDFNPQVFSQVHVFPLDQLVYHRRFVKSDPNGKQPSSNQSRCQSRKQALRSTYYGDENINIFKLYSSNNRSLSALIGSGQRFLDVNVDVKNMDNQGQLKNRGNAPFNHNQIHFDKNNDNPGGAIFDSEKARTDINYRQNFNIKRMNGIKGQIFVQSWNNKRDGHVNPLF